MAKTKVQQEQPCLNDIGAERAVIAALLTHGADAVLDLEELVDTNDFYAAHHRTLFTICKSLVHDQGATTFDVPTLMAKLHSGGFENLVGKGRDEEYLNSLLTETVSMENARSLAAVVFKLGLGRRGYLITRYVQQQLREITGNESVTEILAKMEDPIFGFAAKAVQHESPLKSMAEGYMEILEALASDPKDIIGLPTGFQRFDGAIGGGLRPGAIAIVGARPKIGKSFFCLNVGYNIAAAQVPVLYLDTELPYKWQLLRLASLISGVELNRIENGLFGSNDDEREAVFGAKTIVDSLPFTHCSIAGQSVESALAMVRRWLVRRVGFLPNGKAKPCAVIYDYLKLMSMDDLSHKNMQEFQVLGSFLTMMHNFTLQYDIPMLCTVQLNRDGGEKEDGTVISGSDRILWLASSFSILKRKSAQELQEDPPANGDRKLVVTDTRFGAGMEPGNYINVKADLTRARMSEGLTFGQASKNFTGNSKKQS